MKYDNLKTIPKPISDMAEAVGMKISRVAELVPRVTQDILRTWHTNGEREDLDQEVEHAWKTIFGYEYARASDHIAPLYVKGPPGQGKTSLLRAAVALIADAMERPIVTDPDLYYEPSPRDIIVVLSQLGGAATASGLTGVPTHESGHTVFLPPSRIAKMNKQDFSLLVLDDIDNAMDHIKNVAMPVVLEKALPDVRINAHCYTAMTGNLGALDGTNTGKDSSALINRAGVTLACDTLGDFLERGEKRFTGEHGMAYIDEFLIDNPTNFYIAHDKKYRGQRPTSRGWDALINRLRDMLEAYDKRVAAGLPAPVILSEVGHAACECVGLKVGSQIEQYYSDILTLAHPAAKQAMSDARLSDTMREQLTTLFSKEFTSQSESVARGYMRQVVRRAVRMLKSAVTPVPESQNEKLLATKAISSLLDQYSEACFTVGLVQGQKTPIIAKTTVELFDQVITDLQNDGNQMSKLFGSIDSMGRPVPSTKMIEMLHKSATKYDKTHLNGEALTNISTDKDNPRTALQIAFTEPLTVTARKAAIEEDLNTTVQSAMSR